MAILQSKCVCTVKSIINNLHVVEYLIAVGEYLNVPFYKHDIIIYINYIKKSKVGDKRLIFDEGGLHYSCF